MVKYKNWIKGINELTGRNADASHYLVTPQSYSYLHTSKEHVGPHWSWVRKDYHNIPQLVLEGTQVSIFCVS